MESQDDFFPIIDMVVFMIVCMVKCNGILEIIFLEIMIHKMPLLTGKWVLECKIVFFRYHIPVPD